LNENEAVIFASILDLGFKEKFGKLGFSEMALEAARVIAYRSSARIDLHTTAFSASISRKKEVVVPAFKIKVLRATGAGDAWVAGNLFGDGNNLSDECRLLLANAVSACYLSEPEGNHPSHRKLLDFLEKMK
jgi:sugar/nucleoside kinase (ribokinase family)